MTLLASTIIGKFLTNRLGKIRCSHFMGLIRENKFWIVKMRIRFLYGAQLALELKVATAIMLNVQGRSISWGFSSNLIKKNRKTALIIDPNNLPRRQKFQPRSRKELFNLLKSKQKFWTQSITSTKMVRTLIWILVPNLKIFSSKIFLEDFLVRKLNINLLLWSCLQAFSKN